MLVVKGGCKEDRGKIATTILCHPQSLTQPSFYQKMDLVCFNFLKSIKFRCQSFYHLFFVVWPTPCSLDLRGSPEFARSDPRTQHSCAIESKMIKVVQKTSVHRFLVILCAEFNRSDRDGSFGTRMTIKRAHCERDQCDDFLS
jgi:hypothetical protein